MQAYGGRATNADGTLNLRLHRVDQSRPNRTTPVRLAAGTLVFAGMLLMAWNVLETIAAGRRPPIRLSCQPA